MKFLYGLGGANVPVIQEFELNNPAEKITKGQALKCSDTGLVGKIVDGVYIGVAAEDHSGKEDLLNPRANGNKIRIDITKDAVYSVPMKKLTAVEDGTSTTFICHGDFIMGHHPTFALMLVSKGEGSTNTDAVGTIREIDSVGSSNSNFIYNIEEGGVTCKGDVYALVPYVGYTNGLDYDYSGMQFCSSVGTELTVVGINTTDATVAARFSQKLFD